MKRFLFVVVAALMLATPLIAQDAYDVFKHYTSEKKYTVDGGEIVVTKIVEDLPGTKEDIYGRVKTYFARAYGDSKSVLQTDDKEGGLVIGKGLYTDLASFNLGVWQMKAYHVIRVDIKDGRARIICSASTIIPNSSAHLDNKYEYRIVDHYPMTDKKGVGSKKAQAKALVNLIDRMENSILSLEKVLKEGGVLKSENEDW